MNEHMRGEGAKEMHVRPTMLASHDKLWISLFFELNDVTVFIIIMKIIIMMIIMMVIKRKKLTANVTFLPRTLTLLNSCPPSPWRWVGEPWLRVLPPHVGTPGVGGQRPLLQQEAYAPNDSCPYVFTSVSLSRKTAYFSFLTWSFFTVTLLCCNTGINATK